jgi:hypothetical protein
MPSFFVTQCATKRLHKVPPVNPRKAADPCDWHRAASCKGTETATAANTGPRPAAAPSESASCCHPANTLPVPAAPAGSDARHVLQHRQNVVASTRMVGAQAVIRAAAGASAIHGHTSPAAASPTLPAGPRHSATRWSPISPCTTSTRVAHRLTSLLGRCQSRSRKSPSGRRNSSRSRATIRGAPSKEGGEERLGVRVAQPPRGPKVHYRTVREWRW